MKPIERATERQIQSAEPNASTWVTANAGSGKTRVLTDRVARLLLHGVQPQHILCLTYTKAAATEMQNRLFKLLGEWAMKPDRDLHAALAALGEGGDFNPAALSRARQLFARALETPGGLRIQTIHSFCATLLRRFPLEARVSPGFSELDDRAARLLRAQIIEEMAQSRATGIMADIAQIYTGEDFTQLMEQVARHRDGFARPFTEADAFARFGLAPGMKEDTILRGVFLGGEQALAAEVIPLLRGKGAVDEAAANAIEGLALDQPDMATLEVLQAAFLTKAGTRIKALPTKPAQAALGAMLGPFSDFIDRVEAAQTQLVALNAIRKTQVLHRFAQSFLPLYAKAKEQQGLLDFDDLISHTKGLLTDDRVAAWVLYRLDGGIDHVLVDEAQDTSPDQWRVIELLTAEFTAGQGAQGDRLRTLFVVGDKKQSIYSFQGADVAGFDGKQQAFRAKYEAAGRQFQAQELLYSFRSAASVLGVVDATFKGVFEPALGEGIQHLAVKTALAGRVDLWPLIEPVKRAEDADWEVPIDLIEETHHVAVLADKIAREIKALIAAGTQIPTGEDTARPVHAGDFLILVRRRSALFAEVIRACKKEGLPIAGADRLKLGAELAVKDLAALLSFLATPEDDLSLAALLRSPLCGWGEDDLFRLAHARKGFLWERLRDHAGHAETMEMLRDLRDQADFLRPYDLIERALTRHDGRRRLIARLGPEAEDGIDELLSQALAYEANDVPSLTGFLIWLETGDVTVKRQADSEGRRIRVMTVHGAKGLEAPIVILPDTVDYTAPDRDEIYTLPDDTPVWKTSKDRSPEIITQTRAQRRKDAEAESARLLYVALTRARCWLIVAGAGEAKLERSVNKKPTPLPPDQWCWYRSVERAMRALGAAQAADGMRLTNGDWPEAVPPLTDAVQAAPEIPDWATRPAPVVERALGPISPSDLGGAKVVFDAQIAQSDADALLRGTALHLLLEHLPQSPPKVWAEVAQGLIADPVLRADVLAEAVVVLTAPRLSWVFDGAALCEVPFVAPLGSGVIEGVIDRLIVTPDKVQIIDFKSNAVVPVSAEQVPEGVLRQLGAYAAALGQIYPDRQIETAILWTRSAEIMVLDSNIVSAALHRAAIP